MSATEPYRWLDLADPAEWGDARTVALYHTLAAKDAVARARAAVALESLRRRVPGLGLIGLDFVRGRPGAQSGH